MMVSIASHLRASLCFMNDSVENRISKLLQALAADLLAAGKKVAVAESCTGGWIAKSLTDLAGSSAWFEFGFTTYGNNAKIDLLGVPRGQLEAFGAVSKEVAEAMALGALHRSGADIAVAVTGIAGPDGGTDDKPVGTVWFAWALKQASAHNSTRDGAVTTTKSYFVGDRNEVRAQTVAMALEGLIKFTGVCGE
ncbi:MAG: nicotinamide-nucleotide amidohydrolase family protein [Gammaproteobacteria bacterium]|jgi:nicotinamide-nucleotide amidase|nr:nicotinamide-nucleotide amidohydrolase family protein [Gammaproteobacteria bacterium]